MVELWWNWKKYIEIWQYCQYTGNRGFGVREEQVEDKGLKWALEGWMTSKSVWIVEFWRNWKKSIEIWQYYHYTRNQELWGLFSRALQNNLLKIDNTRNDIYGENFKLKLCTCAQSMALGTSIKFQLEILITSTISAIHKFRENILGPQLAGGR